MDIIDWPASDSMRPITPLRLGVNVPKSGFKGFYTGNRETLPHGADRMTLQMTLPPCTAAQAAEREAFLFGAVSRGDAFRFGAYHRPVNRGTLYGSPTVGANALAGARSLTLAGAKSGTKLLTAGFETDANANGISDGWVSYTNGTTGTVAFALVSGAYQSGEIKVQEVYAPNLGTSGADRAGLVHQGVSVAGLAGTSITLSAYLLTSVSGTGVTLAINFNDGGGTFISQSSQGFTDSAGLSLVRRSFTATVPVGAATANVFLWASTRPSSAGPLYMYADAVQLETGSSATDYAGLPSLLAGDFLSIGGNLVPVGYAGSVANDAGAMTVPLSLPLQKPLTAGAAVIVSRPQGVWELDLDGIDLDYLGTWLQDGVTLPFIQRIV